MEGLRKTKPAKWLCFFLALLLTDMSISMTSLIGLIMLVGIVVNNGIILVDFINQNRLTGSV